MALQGMLAANAKLPNNVTDKEVDQMMAMGAIDFADALISELSKESGKS
jgi:hypothetical protein